MKSIKSASKILLVTAALGLVFVGCERRPVDQTSGASGGSDTSRSSGTMGSSSSGTSGSSGMSGGGQGGSQK